jgi:predicted TIM-barrel fold metal-dependent hydrolase
MLKLFSADDHLVEHRTVWTDRLPAKYKDVGPRVIEEDGAEVWAWEDDRGRAPGKYGAHVSILEKTRPNQATPRADRFEDMLPGCYDPAARAKDMISNGVLASVCFPSVPRFAGVLFTTFKDRELAELCVRAYNDFVIDEWCPGGPEGMYVPMVMGNLRDQQSVADEIRRCAARGARAITMPEHPVPLGLPSYYSEAWNPVWRACEETGLVICLHIGTSGWVANPSPDDAGAKPVRITLMPGVGSQIALVNLLFTEVFNKFPNLKFVLSESGIGWTSYAVDRANLVAERYRTEADEGTPWPSDIFRRNFHVCQVEEHVAPGVIERLGVDRVLWELDYPHADCSWPFAQQQASEVFEAAKVTPEVIEQVTWTNPCQIFNWTPASTDLLPEQ